MKMMLLRPRTFALLCLFCMCMRDIKTEDINVTALRNTVTLMKNACNPNRIQYGVSTNVNRTACTNGPDQNMFSEDQLANGELVKLGFYKGKKLNCALPYKKNKKKNKNKKKYHSEYRLMIQSNPEKDNDYLIREQQQKDNNGCLILYTYHSPCLKQCLNISHQYTIMNELQTFRQHQGLKAFVFETIYGNDQNQIDAIKELLAVVNSSVPVFRCSNNQCIRCFNNNPIPDCFNVNRAMLKWIKPVI